MALSSSSTAEKKQLFPTPAPNGHTARVRTSRWKGERAAEKPSVSTSARRSAYGSAEGLAPPVNEVSEEGRVVTHAVSVRAAAELSGIGAKMMSWILFTSAGFLPVTCIQSRSVVRMQVEAQHLRIPLSPQVVVLKGEYACFQSCETRTRP